MNNTISCHILKYNIVINMPVALLPAIGESLSFIYNNDRIVKKYYV